MKVYAIIQGALWCKGYPAHYGSITEFFDSGTATGIKNLKYDAGIDSSSATVTINVMKALLSMNQYKIVRGGKTKIQAIQRYFNNHYENYIGLSPCDGLYAREMNKALVKILQAIQGYTVSGATGNFGDGTKSNLYKVYLPETNNKPAIYLLRAALCCNGYDISLGDEWDTEISNTLKSFQKDMILTENGKADTNTWMALLVSRGNLERPSNGCDTRFEMTDARLAILKNKGYEVVGRYLTGGSFKELRTGEIERILRNGIKMFPIFQESGTNLNYFTSARGKEDAVKSSAAARKYGVPKDSIIYFAVDTDPQDTDIANKILPYFKALSENFDPDFKVGVYGTRNTCTQVCEKGYAVTCFVSDMSYGFSGNMGFKIPSNWNFDQYCELKVSETGWDFDLDKTTYSKRFPVVDHVEHRNYVRPAIEPVPSDAALMSSFITRIKELETEYQNYYSEEIMVRPDHVLITPQSLLSNVLGYLRAPDYGNWEWFFTTGSGVDNNFISYVKAHNSTLYNYLNDYIKKGDRKDVTDGNIGVIDFSHMAATMAAYFGGVLPNFWASWGGDLATGMKNTTTNIGNKNNPDSIYYGWSDKEIADATIGKVGLECNYSDFCSDFDAFKIQAKIKEMDKEGENYHLLSDALTWYYGNGLHNDRFKWITEELNCTLSLGSLNEAVYKAMNGLMEKAPIVGLLALKGDGPSEEVNKAACNSFANYIYSMNNQS